MFLAILVLACSPLCAVVQFSLVQFIMIVSLLQCVACKIGNHIIIIIIFFCSSFPYNIQSCAVLLGMPMPHGGPATGPCPSPAMQTLTQSSGPKPWPEGLCGMHFLIYFLLYRQYFYYKNR